MSVFGQFAQGVAAPLGAKAWEPISREYYEKLASSPSMDFSGSPEQYEYLYGGDVPQEKYRDSAQRMITLLDHYGAASTAELPEDVIAQLGLMPGGLRQSGKGMSLMELALPVMALAALPASMMFGGGAAAAAGGASSGSSAGTAAGLTAAEEAAMLTGAGVGGGGAATGAGTAAAAGTGAATTTTSGSNAGNIQVAAAEPTTMTDVSPGLFGGGETTAPWSASEEAAMLTGSGTGSGGAVTSNSLWDAIVKSGGNLAGKAVEQATGGIITQGLFNDVTGLGSTGGTTNNTGGTNVGGQGYQFPWESVLEGLIGTYFKGEQIDDLTKAINAAAAKADPFASQRPQYQQQFSALTSNPSNFFDDPAIKEIIDFSLDSSGRKLASQGYNMSGNMAQELTRTAQREAFGQYIPYTNMIGQAAGAQLGTGRAGEVAGQGAAQIAGLQGQYQAGLGSIFGNIARGQQPTQAGAKPNQTLMQHFLV